ncbi:hypothetical protein RHSIM_Rhsim06G0092000 [Rhododendron simsii]|uniref:Uncharacterized protein n=1 Tax=Rhododendron simsii TaxID=118357 RepID=A0A834GVE9_RHOSS|nr:hypothetical protein RHSIM_Rhsim06G0092000 [Rhododendron simsii]
MSESDYLDLEEGGGDNEASRTSAPFCDSSDTPRPSSYLTSPSTATFPDSNCPFLLTCLYLDSTVVWTLVTTRPWSASTLSSLSHATIEHREQSKRYNPEDMQTKIEGKNCIVTGANSGIGYATAEGLASRGANVYMVCHSKERGEAARSKIQSMIGNENVYLEFSRGNFDGVEQYARNKRIQVRKDRMLFNFIGFH